MPEYTRKAQCHRVFGMQEKSHDIVIQPLAAVGCGGDVYLGYGLLSEPKPQAM